MTLSLSEPPSTVLVHSQAASSVLGTGDSLQLQADIPSLQQHGLEDRFPLPSGPTQGPQTGSHWPGLVIYASLPEPVARPEGCNALTEQSPVT